MLNDVIFLLCSGGLAVLDLVLVFYLNRRISPVVFKHLAKATSIASLVFWAALWTSVLWLAWDWFYGFIFPAWLRAAAPALGLVYAAIGLALWGLASRSRLPVIAFCLLGGLEGILSHTWAIFGLNLLQKVPLMGTSTAIPVLVFAFFEKILYWSAILWIAHKIAFWFSRARSAT